jgi:hypothetical protein
VQNIRFDGLVAAERCLINSFKNRDKKPFSLFLGICFRSSHCNRIAPARGWPAAATSLPIGASSCWRHSLPSACRRIALDHDRRAAGETLGDRVGDQELLVGYDDELVGRLADRMAAADIGRVPILSRSNGEIVGLLTRRDLLRVRANVLRHEREREVLLWFRPRPRVR